MVYARMCMAGISSGVFTIKRPSIQGRHNILHVFFYREFHFNDIVSVVLAVTVCGQRLNGHHCWRRINAQGFEYFERCFIAHFIGSQH